MWSLPVTCEVDMSIMAYIFRIVKKITLFFVWFFIDTILWLYSYIYWLLCFSLFCTFSWIFFQYPNPLRRENPILASNPHSTMSFRISSYDRGISTEKSRWRESHSSSCWADSGRAINALTVHICTHVFIFPIREAWYPSRSSFGIARYCWKREISLAAIKIDAPIGKAECVKLASPRWDMPYARSGRWNEAKSTIGSNTFPNLVHWSNLRAYQPSKASRSIQLAYSTHRPILGQSPNKT